MLLFRMRSGAVAKHLELQGRAGTDPSFIHAYSGQGVVESSLRAPWARRIVARFSFPEGDGTSLGGGCRYWWIYWGYICRPVLGLD